MASGPITSWQIDEEIIVRFYFLGLQNQCRWWLQPWNLRCLPSENKAITNLDSIKKQRHNFADKPPPSQGYGFSSSHVGMQELDNKEGWAWKDCCFYTVVLEKTLDSPLDCKEIKPISSKGNQSLTFIGKTHAEPLILWPPDVKSWLFRKDHDSGKNWRSEEQGMTEDEMVGWHHWLNGHEFAQAPADGEGLGSLAGCSPWGHKE